MIAAGTARNRSTRRPREGAPRTTRRARVATRVVARLVSSARRWANQRGNVGIGANMKTAARAESAASTTATPDRFDETGGMAGKLNPSRAAILRA